MWSHPLLPLLRMVSAASGRFRRRFTGAGQLLWAGTAVSGAVGVDTQLTQVHQLFALLMALLSLAILLSLRFRPTLEVHRHLPRLATVGAPLEYLLEVRNQGRRPTPVLELLDPLHAPPLTREELQGAHEPGEERRNWFDRQMGFHRYQWLLRQRLGGTTGGPVPLGRLAPGREGRVRLALHPQRRGRLQWREVTVARPDPLGLCRAFHRVPLAGSLVVLPRTYRLPPGVLPGGGRLYQPGGVSLASSVGDAEEFVALREYRTGDSPRRIHWPSWAKSGQPMVREYQEEFFVRHALALDTFAPPGEPFEEAVSVAASFASGVEGSEGLLDLLFVGETAHRFTAGRGVAHPQQLLEVLAGVEPAPRRPFATLAGLILEHAATLSGTILVLQAWDRERRQLAANLVARGIPVLVLLVVPAGGGLPAPDPGPLAGHPERLVVLPVGEVAHRLARL